MATYKLTYFDLRGLGEHARLIFHAAGKEFQDIRLPIDTTTWARPEFDAMKASGAFDVTMGKVPTLEVTENGATTKLGQSRAIERFLARRFGFFGDNDIEAARIDMICEHIRDIKDAYTKPAPAPTGTPQGDEATATFLSKDLPEWLAKMEKTVDGDGFAVGKKLSLAGILIYAFLTSYFDKQDACDNTVAGCPKLVKIRDQVAAVPGIAKWVAERPKTAF